MIAYLFTGTRALLPRHWPALIEDAQGWGNPPANTGMGEGLCFISGMQYGADTALAGLAYELYPAALHYLVKPAAPCNGALPGLLPNAKVVQAAPGRNHAEAYRLRDQHMVDLAVRQAAGGSEALPSYWRAVCLAYPLREEGSQRYSGTWLTVRMARKAGLDTQVRQLEPSRTTALTTAPRGGRT